MQTGDIIVFADSSKKWFSVAQRFFTRMPHTHVANVGFSYGNLQTLQEANESMSVTDLKNVLCDEKQEYWVFHLKIPYFIKNQVLVELFREYGREPYAFLQLLYFVRRYIWETKWVKKVFGWIPRLLDKPGDVRQWNNWFPGNFICSEYSCWEYVSRCLKGWIKYTESYNDPMLPIPEELKVEIESTLHDLSKWNSNNFHSGDAFNFMRRHPSLFIHTEHREFKNFYYGCKP
jgi:hypothetical protein